MAWDNMTLMFSVELPNICFRETCSWLCIYMSNACSADCSAMQLILVMMHPNRIWSRLLDSHVDMKGNRMGNCANMSYQKDNMHRATQDYTCLTPGKGQKRKERKRKEKTMPSGVEILRSPRERLSP